MSDTRTAHIAFHGGAGSVTGSNFLLDAGSARILIDCGLLQDEGADEYNYRDFPYEPASIHALVVTHAHLDHIGRIPRLVRAGFRGPIRSTPATRELASLMFEDALSIMQHEQEERQKKPLYDEADVRETLAQWEVHDYHDEISLTDDITLSFLDAGHILGSAMACFTRNGKKLVFTGDLGNSPAPILRDTESIAGAHFMVMESVYGDRNHEHRDERADKLRQVVRDTLERKRTLLIPAFSIQRTQVLLTELNDMVERGELEPVPVFLDAPLATRVTDVYRRYTHLFNDAVRERISEGDDIFDFPGLTVTSSFRESRAIRDKPSPKVIIAGAGMSHGGRIRMHEKEHLGDTNTTILFVGYQTAGSLGRRIQDGARKVRIDDDWIRVHATVEMVSGYSAHKDMDNLIAFAGEAADTLEEVFLAMGEPKSSLFLAQRLRDFLGVHATVPQAGEACSISW